MANYDWRDYSGRAWRDRFPTDVRAGLLWRELSLERPPIRLMEARSSMASPPRLCVFVSHRQADVRKALRIAYLAWRAGFDYWLDVIDPTLPHLSASASPHKTAIAIASVIEMALLNSTHVVAVMTPNTKGSQWVPYEYGRVKAPAPVSLQAACWLDSALVLSSIPEYLYLGKVTRTEADLTAWLASEFASFGPASSGPRSPWPGPTPAPL